jgi:hypothetical protein
MGQSNPINIDYNEIKYTETYVKSNVCSLIRSEYMSKYKKIMTENNTTYNTDDDDDDDDDEVVGTKAHIVMNGTQISVRW